MGQCFMWVNFSKRQFLQNGLFPSGAYADVSALYTLAPGSRRYPRRMYSRG